jgi:predicted transcriptional regulator
MRRGRQLPTAQVMERFAQNKAQSSMQQNLDLSHDVLRLVRVGSLDARVKSDDFLSLRELVMRSEGAYPGIGRWFDSKVSDGVRSGGRIGLIGLINDIPIAAGILKRGQITKFCHLNIDEASRSRSLGDLLFTLMTLDVRHLAKRVRFTLPESVWEDRKSFFNAFSFSRVEKAGRQYRLFDTELYSETPYPDLFTAARAKLPRLFGQLAIGDHSLLTGAVLAMRPVSLEKIFAGIKTVEIRARFSKRWEGRRVSLYAEHPISGLSGEATITRVIESQPDRIWEHFGSQIGCTRAEYDIYIKGRSTVQALCLSDVKSFRDPVLLSQLSYLLGLSLAAPKSYLSLGNHDGWLEAVVLAAALQGSIRIRTRSTSNPPENVPYCHYASVIERRSCY